MKEKRERKIRELNKKVSGEAKNKTKTMKKTKNVLREF